MENDFFFVHKIGMLVRFTFFSVSTHLSSGVETRETRGLGRGAVRFEWNLLFEASGVSSFYDFIFQIVFVLSVFKKSLRVNGNTIAYD